MKSKIWLSSPHIGSNELLYVNEAFATNWIAPLGPHVNTFEQGLQLQTNTSHAAALSSGTSAIHLALILLGVKAGDIVFCQSMTFSASANPIAYQGAIPVFIDSERDTWNMDPALLKISLEEAKQNEKLPKAIVPVHLYGMPAKMKEILSIANEYGVPVIEDAAEALGSNIDNKPCGSFGEFGVLSFNGNKIITTSGGGALLSKNAEMIEKARFLATQARDSAPHYQHSHIGYNYRMSNVLAGIGRGQLEVLSDRVKARRNNFERYKKYFSKHNYAGFTIKFQEAPSGYYSNRWLTCILVDPAFNNGLTREVIRLSLEEENIESRPLWKPMHQQPIFANSKAYLNGVSDRLFEDGLCLPSGSNLTDEEFDRIFESLDNLFAKYQNS
ncbi:DegT/DnrJ/EryC1/StrS family aminotransferase [Aquirufa antheringensis]|uniref:DegT/DnrJ/EryC1/StrS family aminotransferase n=1 Tax=Aquirufa antheringensis TaxID=2516559 RepID=UPI001032A6C5|nr:aminotransferase class I/II-fold pyridoxal phosphate-dependent enzyme [Aquirufa antheringensis]TBH71745.1 aminotransferase class I/II-fold pyridoxal phosphate-dependent enzyme [Aquirufa antheringensis]